MFPLRRNFLAEFLFRQPGFCGVNIALSEFMPALTPRDSQISPAAFEEGSEFFNLP